MDLKDWGIPVLGSITAILTGILGFQKINRQRSADSLAEAENSLGVDYVEILRNERDAAHARAEGVWKLYLEARDKIQALELRGVMRDEKITKLERQVEKLTSIVLQDHPEWGQLLSGFGSLEHKP